MAVNNQGPREPRLMVQGQPKGTLRDQFNRLDMAHERRNKRIREARQMNLGQLEVPLPPKITEAIMRVVGPNANVQALKIRLPQGTTVPLKTTNVLQRKRPRLRREPVGMGLLSRRESTKIEQWVNAALETVQLSDKPLLDWGKLIDLLFNEGECGLVIVPVEAGWERVPTFLEAANDPKSIRRVYQRDEKGNKKTDYPSEQRKGYSPSSTKSKQAYETILNDYMARRLPWSVRVIHATDCAPQWGPNGQLDGLIIRQTYARNSLIKRGFKWKGMDEHLSPIDAETGTHASGPEVTVYEWYGVNEDGDIFMQYEVEGNDTWREQGEEKVDATINLTEEYGLTRLPATYKYGWHFETKDTQDRGIPFIWPFIQSLLGVDALSTATVFHTWWLAFGGKYYKPDPNLPAEAWLFEGQPRSFDMEPMKFQALPGDVQDVGNRNVGDDVHKMISMMAGSTEQEMPGGGGQAFGAGAAQSGLDRSMMRNYLEDSVSQVLLGAKEAYEFAGEIILELACHLAEEEDIGIPVYATINVGPKGTNTTKSEKQLVILEPGDAGIIYDLTAYFPTKHGEYLAAGQQLAEFVKQELATFEEFREMVFGDEHPEETRIALMVNRLLNSPVGQQYVLELAMEYLGETKMKQMVQGQQEGQMTEGGTPTAALTGVLPSNPGNVMSGMGTVNPGVQQLGGAVSGGIGMRDASRMSAMRSRTQSGPEGL